MTPRDTLLNRVLGRVVVTAWVTLWLWVAASIGYVTLPRLFRYLFVGGE